MIELICIAVILCITDISYDEFLSTHKISE
jgi:hypothetical protein